MPLRVYLAVVAVLLVLPVAVGGIHGWLQTTHDARVRAEQDAAFAARLAAKEIAADLGRVGSSVAPLAANPAIAAALAATPTGTAIAGCTLTFAGVGNFTTGHLDIVRPDGSVACSSLPQPPPADGPGYRDAEWLSPALTKPASIGPIVDNRTGRQALVTTAPVPGHGVVAAFVDFESLGPGLADRLGGPRRLEFLVATSDRRTVLSRSIAAARWQGASLVGSAFARAIDKSEKPGVDGVPRLYGTATVEGRGWHVFAGADRDDALAAARDLYKKQLVIILFGLALALGALLVVHLRIARPTAQLVGMVRAAADGSEPRPMTARAPTEITELATEFDGLVADVDRELAERRRSEHAYRLLFDSHPQPMWVHDVDTLAFLQVNDATVAHYGYTRDELSTATIELLHPPDSVPDVLRTDGTPTTVDHVGPWPHRKKDGTAVEVQMTTHALSFDGRRARFVMAEDVTERERLERQLRQSQRLESLGQLAGGVAHDFNNLLAVILNYASFVNEQVAAAASESGDETWETARQDIEQVVRAAERGAALTHQLLAFARREVVRPQVVNVNDVVRGIEQLLRRTIGEDIELVTSMSPDLAAVTIDPGQLEQVLLNLAVNARDAMPTGGRLTIDTADVDIDEHYAAGHLDVSPGPYVRIRVSDNGTGMDKATLDHVFEPFYTTKPKGEGTGLGLATVYGIISQAGGYVHIYSEVGLGTTFNALLPATTEAVSREERPASTPRPAGESTILVVEDEDALREVTRRILTRNGYQVLTAGDGQEAIAVASRHVGTIDVILTDVVMPQLSGKEVVEAVAGLYPGIRVVYMSGYAHTVLGAKGSLDEGVHLVEKPFSESTLLTTLATVLDHPPLPST